MATASMRSADPYSTYSSRIHQRPSVPSCGMTTSIDISTQREISSRRLEMSSWRLFIVAGRLAVSAFIPLRTNGGIFINRRHCGWPCQSGLRLSVRPSLMIVMTAIRRLAALRRSLRKLSTRQLIVNSMRRRLLNIR